MTLYVSPAHAARLIAHGFHVIGFAGALVKVRTS